MSQALPRLYADDRGVWREDRPGQRFGIEWGEIAGVGGYKLDGITEVFIVIELNFEYGEWLELHAEWPGFPEVVEAITGRLPGIRRGWLAEVERLKPREAPVSLWHRSSFVR